MLSSSTRDILDICSAEAASSVEPEVKLLHQFAHPFHRHHHSLRARRLLFHRGVDLVRHLVQPRRRLGDLRRAVRLFVGGRADLLCELEDFGHDVGDLLQSAR